MGNNKKEKRQALVFLSIYCCSSPYSILEPQDRGVNKIFSSIVISYSSIIRLNPVEHSLIFLRQLNDCSNPV